MTTAHNVVDAQDTAAAMQANAAGTRLERSIAPLVRAHPDQSGIFALSEGRDAFAARLLLADAAERTLDAQYYIWHDDMSGTLLFDALRRAAERGVRVRLLLDDNPTQGLDTLLAALDSHPNIEVRLFNPFRFRRWRILNYVTEFARLNRRMHNKSFTVDNQATIVGGRNVGDEYFGAGQGVAFSDLDVAAIGPVVDDVSRDFERYWSCASAYRADRVLAPVGREAISGVAAAATRIIEDPAALAYTEALARSPFVRKLLACELPFEWARTTLISDDPAKGLGRAGDDALLWPQLEAVLGAPAREVQIVSAYFVPGTKGVQALAKLARRGIAVKILTNALEATDVPAVHAGYAKRREPLLEAGIVLFELKRRFAGPEVKERGPMGSSSASLHAKTMAVDRCKAFVGSFNFDPRSARLNTEMGFVIEGASLAQMIADAFSDEIPLRAYSVRMSGNGSLAWAEAREEGELLHEGEPGTSLWQRAAVSVLALLPIEWLL